MLAMLHIRRIAGNSHLVTARRGVCAAEQRGHEKEDSDTPHITSSYSKREPRTLPNGGVAVL